MINVNETIATWDAAAKSFIPNHRLNIPRVRVSTAKNSTVPKSDIVSIKTKDNPATIAGLDIGSATLKKVDFPTIQILAQSEIKICEDA